jgi:hypothetical protein
VGDNYYAALNSAVFSDGSFVYIPKGVKSAMELSTYFRINAQETGQVTLCSLPTYAVLLLATAVATIPHPDPYLHPACCHGFPQKWHGLWLGHVSKCMASRRHVCNFQP